MYDIQTKNNSIGGRQGWAYVCNSGEVKVLKANLDLPQKYEDYKTYGNVRVVWNYRGRENYKTCQLAWNACDGKANWELTSGGCFLSSSFGLRDAIELIEDSQCQVLRKDDIVAIASYSKKQAFIQLYKLDGRIDINCQTVATLRPLTDDEMSEVVTNVNRWLR